MSVGALYAMAVMGDRCTCIRVAPTTARALLTPRSKPRRAPPKPTPRGRRDAANDSRAARRRAVARRQGLQAAPRLLRLSPGVLNSP